MAGHRRNKRKPGTTNERQLEEDDGAGLVEQELTPEELRDRGEELISWLVKREQVEGKKGAAVEKFNAELKLAKERIHVLTREIDTKKAYVDPQESLPFNKPPGQNDAQAAAS